ncbi:MAG TPA: hypothetical protein VHM91_10410 [Verrucomicrobiales bacterium]|nr:hypothetical protein [Verrucomicrobiales bacterium]
MSPSSYRVTIVASLAAVVTAFVAGRWSVSQPEEGTGRSGTTRAVRNTGNTPSSAGSKAASARPAAATALTEAIPSKERLTPLLKERNRLKRLKSVLEWAESIDEKNWRDALAVWLRSGASSGFGRDIEARVVFERIGAVGGAEAIAAIEDSDRSGKAVTWRLRQTVAGWASAHPQEAMDSYLQGGAQPGELRGGLMEGLAQSDLNLARQLSEQVQEGWRDEHIRGIIENMERNGEGEQAVRAWIDQSQSENKNPEYTGQIITTYVERELELMQAGAGDASVFDWLSARTSFPGDSFEVLGTAAVTLAHSHPEEAVNWLSGLKAGAMSPEGIEEAVTGVVLEWQSMAPGGADAWLKANPSHPMHTAVENARSRIQLVPEQ